VLELGCCASGGNLIPLAERMPEASLTGVDLSRGQVAEALAVILRLALSAGIEILTEPRRVGRGSDPRPEVCPLVRLETQEGQTG
jgi:cyclopropane fatty-acyl-phospholipid synthase-like methyltransferase